MLARYPPLHIQALAMPNVHRQNAVQAVEQGLFGTMEAAPTFRWFMIRKFLKHVVPGVMKPMQIVWNQVIGFFFIVLAVRTVPSLIRAWREFDGEGKDFFRLGLTLAFGLIMAGYGIFSFLRARKISRS